MLKQQVDKCIKMNLVAGLQLVAGLPTKMLDDVAGGDKC